MLDAISLDNIINRNFITLRRETLITEFYALLADSTANIFAVTDKDGGLEGIILLDQVRKQLFNEKDHSGTVEAIMTNPPAVIDYLQSAGEVMEAFDALDVWQLPVLKNGVFIGFISKSAMLSQYRDVIIKQHKEADLFARG